MDERVIELDSSKMHVLSEFDAETTVHKNAQEKYGADFYRIGLLENFVLISTKSEVSEEDLQVRLNVIKTGNERARRGMETWMRHDWWNVHLVFETGSYDQVLERLEEIYDLKPYKEIDLNKIEIRQGNDKMAVRLNSVTPHDVGESIVTLQMVNYRLMAIDDGITDDMWQLITTPETGYKIMTEMQRLRTKILNNQG